VITKIIGDFTTQFIQQRYNFLVLANRLETLYPQIRQKFGSALTNWHPSDPSAKVILEPWIKVKF
jgi:GC-rich sequence DNA-binding factor-like protein.